MRLDEDLVPDERHLFRRVIVSMQVTPDMARRRRALQASGRLFAETGSTFRSAAYV